MLENLELLQTHPQRQESRKLSFLPEISSPSRKRSNKSLPWQSVVRRQKAHRKKLLKVKRLLQKEKRLKVRRT
jgi:hypothetical protein